jgi:hypothetical protein
MTAGETARPALAESLLQRLQAAILTPIRAFRLAYLPPLMVYFAYGALGLTAIASSFWVKRSLKITPAELAALGVWLSLPWAMKMVVGELVDTVRILGSQRRAYVFAGAGLIAFSMLMLAGAAGGWLRFATPERIYVIAAILAVLGVVIQDVVADAMTTEVVERQNADGSPRPQAEVDAELAMVQVLGRIFFTTGMFAVAWLGGYLASVWPPERVFLLGLIIPAISVTGALLVRTDTVETRPTDWRILGGGIAFGGFVAALALLDIPFGQELTFLVSLGVIGTMLMRVTGDLPTAAKMRIFYAALIIFLFRVTPSTGEGYRWFLIDRYGFDERFFGTLNVVGTALTLVVAWLLSDALTRMRMTSVLLWLTAIGAVLSLPSLLLVLDTKVAALEQATGIGAHSLAIIDTATSSPLAALGMIPLLALIAINAPAGHRATWFALMSSFMNLALVGGEIFTRYLNTIFVVDRGQYAALPALTFTAIALSIAIPVLGILAFRRRVD